MRIKNFIRLAPAVVAFAVACEREGALFLTPPSSLRSGIADTDANDSVIVDANDGVNSDCNWRYQICP